MRIPINELLKERGYQIIENINDLSPYISRKYIASSQGGILPLLALTPDECREWLRVVDDYTIYCLKGRSNI